MSSLSQENLTGALKVRNFFLGKKGGILYNVAYRWTYDTVCIYKQVFSLKIMVAAILLLELKIIVLS